MVAHVRAELSPTDQKKDHALSTKRHSKVSDHAYHKRASSNEARELEKSRDSNGLEDGTESRARTATTRSDSYSSVKEDVRGFPQSFIQSPKRKSYEASDANELNESVFWDESPIEADRRHPSNKSPLEKLPFEILEQIIGELTVELQSVEYAPRNKDLVSCLLTSKSLHSAALTVLYRQVTLPHSLVFAKYSSNLDKHPELGSLVRRLDLSHFTSLGLGRTRKANQEIPFFTSSSFLKCLEQMPKIQELLLQEHVDQDIDQRVLEKIFYGLPQLQALDLCAASTASFVSAFSGAIAPLRSNSALTVNLRRLCLHECFTIQSKDIELLLSRLPRLTLLDAHHTRITDKALASIPHSARLTHLNLGRCAAISGSGVVDFLRTHPATRGLIYLNLACDISRYRLLDETDVDALLPILPPTLRSLSLSGAMIQSRHMSLLMPLTRFLEELSLGYADLSMADICSIFQVDEEAQGSVQQPSTSSSLYYLDLAGITALTQPSLFTSLAKTHLLGRSSLPLEVLELSSKLGASLQSTKVANKQLGWTVKEFGRRSWYVREPSKAARVGRKGDVMGSREWKMGSQWWGMRKVPVAWSEVGGIYGHYMFKT